MWVILPNCGDILELLVPSFIRKDVSGRINSPCKVISQKTSEKNVDYRGSKSAAPAGAAVKEQRVDGSRCFSTKHLRCTLMGKEIYHQVKTTSKQIINKRLYSSAIERSMNNKYSLNP